MYLDFQAHSSKYSFSRHLKFLLIKIISDKTTAIKRGRKLTEQMQRGCQQCITVQREAPEGIGAWATDFSCIDLIWEVSRLLERC